jgi:hypothetical protein
MVRLRSVFWVLVRFFLSCGVALPALARPLSNSTCQPLGEELRPPDQALAPRTQQGDQASAIAIGFLRLNRPDRTEQINQTIQRQLRLSDAQMAQLAMSQNREVGKVEVTIAMLEMATPSAVYCWQSCKPS